MDSNRSRPDRRPASGRLTLATPRVLAVLFSAVIALSTFRPAAGELVRLDTAVRSVRGSRVELGAGSAQGLRPGLRGKVILIDDTGGSVVEIVAAVLLVESVAETSAVASLLKGDPATLRPGLLARFEVEAAPPSEEPAGGGDSVEVAFVSVPAGAFDFGCSPGDSACDPDEIPARRVTLERSFYLASTEITRRQFATCVRAGQCSGSVSSTVSTRGAEADLPAEGISFEEAERFCRWIGARLPTEVEWERAARGTRLAERFPWGNEPPVCRPGATNGARFDDGLACPDAGSVVVGSYSPNGLGLFDMAGNAWEWVRSTGSGAAGSTHTLRGGSWSSSANALRVSNRLVVPLDAGGAANAGFRCAQDP